MKKTVVIIGVLLVIVAVGGGSFWAGMRVGENRIIQDPARLFQQMRGEAGQFREQFPGMMGTPQPGKEGAPLRGGIRGTIEAVEGDTLVVSTEEGETRVQTTDTTLIEKSMAVGVEDLEVGEQVVVSGSRNDDGSVIARSIRISTAP
ncbi:MAG: DUF5666 domain-containing protein [Anaerolineae bacterium]